MADEIGDVRQQFQEQVNFFRRKLNLPSETWRDIQRSAHDRAFMVAGVMKADLLADLRKAVDQSVQGGSIGEFRKQFDEIVAKHGWTGWTGEGSAAGEAWRTKVIYQTNVATSYAAGRRAQLLDPDLLARRPYWRYVHSDGVSHPRPQHKQWGDMRLTLRHDDPFWETHYPPNGWGCKCRVVPVAKPAEGDATAPPDDWHQNDPRTGAPVGIDEGWDYAPGARADADMRSFVQEKLIDYPPAIQKAFYESTHRYLNTTERVTDFVNRVNQSLPKDEDLWLGFVESKAATQIQALTGTKVDDFLVLLSGDNIRHTNYEHQWDGNGQRPPTPEDYLHVLSFVNQPDSMKLGPTLGRGGQQRVVIRKEIGGETFRAVFELLTGKKNRALKLISLAIKN